MENGNTNLRAPYLGAGADSIRISQNSALQSFDMEIEELAGFCKSACPGFSAGADS